MLWRTLPLQKVSDQRGTMEDYCEALREFSNAAIWNVVFALRDGTVKDASDEWSPRAPKLARWVREEQARLDAVAENEKRRATKRITDDEYRREEFTVEHRERMKWKFMILSASLHGDKQATETLRGMYPHLFNGGTQS